MMTAYGRIGIRRAEVTTQHLTDAQLEANLIQVEFSNRQPNLFQDELYSVPLVAGTATYTLPARMVSIQAPYITIDSSGTAFDRIIYGYSTWEYAATPDKTQQGSPTIFWYDRIDPPVIYLWPVPDSSASYTLNLRILHQFQDVNFQSGTTVAAPYRWLDAWISALAARLAQIYNPAIVDRMDARAERSWAIAATEDKEDVPMFIQPQTYGYYR